MDNNILNTPPVGANGLNQQPAPEPAFQSGTPTPQQVGQPLIQQNKKSKAPIIIAVIILVILLTAGAVVAIIMLGQNQKIAKYTENAQQLMVKVRSEKGENSIYFDKDLQKIDAELFKNPDGENYSEESYAIRGTDETKICLNDDNYRVDNLDGDMKLSKVEERGKCELKLDASNIIKYLSNYYEQKYDLKVRVNDSKKNNDKYIIFTDKGAIYATFEIKDKEIIIEDDSEELIAGYTSLSDIRALISEYVNEVQKDKTEGDDKIEDVRLYNQDYIILQSTLTEQDALEFTQKLSDYLVSKNIKNLLLFTTCYSYEIVEGDTRIVIDYKITLDITNGEARIETDKE